MTKQLLLPLLMMMTICNGFAQQIIPLWEDKDIPNYQKSDEKELIPERDIVFIKKIQKPTLTVFLPSKQSANGKAVLILPGGGYAGVSYDWEGTDYAKWLNSKGVAAFVLKYRMPQARSVKTSYLAPIQDAQRAMRIIRNNASEYNVDLDKVGVIGSSAGGHLASTLGTHTKAYYPAKDNIDQHDFRPNFMLLIYPVITMNNEVTHKGSRNNLLGKNPSKELVAQFSNELQVDANTPPTFIIHSGDDGVVQVENAILFYQALVKNKVKADMHLYPTGGHGYGMGIPNDKAPKWATLAEEWLEK
ncbi:alpha/beta hydrolase [Flammeovirga aprica]|uniref:Alpha/beta hydrolase n=1 Tax=Flammeovirga aprica JL-4 TaxID=694437 RepID=A0A7X9S179_9BACT|nr:alpha/beta hydrolase [Flammeovirga aprica]NME72441.1 alpha/beta hydrolase [Flammeovirga aprica JL-4]